MNVLPMRALALPNSSLFEAGGHGQAVGTDALVQAHIGDDGHVSHYANVGRTHARIVAARDAAQVEVEAVEVHPFHELSQRLRLERGQRRITKLLIRGPVRGRDALQKTLIQAQELAFEVVGHGLFFSRASYSRPACSSGAALRKQPWSRGADATPRAGDNEQRRRLGAKNRIIRRLGFLAAE